MQKSVRKALVVLSILCFLSASFAVVASFAQDEDEGFVKRMWKKARRAKQTEEVPKSPEVVVSEEVEEVEVEIAPKEKQVPASEIKVPERLDKEFMLDVMRSNLDAYGNELSGRIPNIVAEALPGEKVAYKFKKETGEIVDFENLDKDKLFVVYRTLLNEANMIRTERMNRQLQQIRQVQQQIQQARPPQVVKPPTLPQIPQPPRIPTPPPQPPRPPQQRR